MSVPLPRRLTLLTLAGALAAVTAGPPAVARAATGATPALGARQALGLGTGVTDPRALAAADLDGDGRTDLVAGSANGGAGMVSILRGTGGGAFASPLGNPFGLGGTPGGVGALAVGDLNGDSRPDVLATIGSGTTDDNQLVTLVGDGAGTLTATTPVTLAGEQLAGVALADLDGDGDLDALAASATAVEGLQLAVVEQDAGGALTPVGALGATGTLLARALAVGDLTGDGHPDALVASSNAGAGSAWIASGTGLALSAGTPVAVGADPVAAAVGDVDGDGDLDGLVLDGAANLLTVLRNDGSGTLTADGLLVDGLASGTGVAVGDVNGDGHLDAIVTDGATGLVGVLPGDGAGAFGSATWATAAAGARSPVVADLDGDGDPDVATADASGDSISLVRNVGVPAPASALSAAFAGQAVGTTGPARTVTITNGGSGRLRVTGVLTAGGDADDFLLTGDTCTGASVASDGVDACTVRVRFAPSDAGTRSTALRLRLAGGTTHDVPLSAVGTETAAPDAGATPDTTTTPAATTTTTTTPAAATTTTPATPAATPTPAAAKKRKKAKASATTRLILTLSHTKLTAEHGAKVKVGLALGRDAKLVLRVKRKGRTVDIARASGREGANTITWDGKLGKKTAPAGAYRLDVYAVAADGRAARKSVALVITP
jgi:FG-GAP-like repeat